jgi:sterol desaturase/sphingolipid hydroxylase (fatty acid hydroxylase superfamily)
MTSDNSALAKATMPLGLRRVVFPLVVACCMYGVALGIDYLLLPDESMLAAARDGRRGILAGELLQIRGAEIGALAMWAARIVLLPLLLLGSFFVVERIAGPSGRERKNYRLIWLTQSIFLIIAILVSYLVVRMVQLSSNPLIQIDKADDVFPASMITLAMFIAALLIGDFLLYWVHRALHAVPLLWKFHRVHHSPRDLDVLHNVIHPIEMVVRLFFITIPISLLIHVDMENLSALSTAIVVLIYLQHMNIPVNLGRFGNLIVDNRYHFVHHSPYPAHYNKNYAGLFPILDILFGTYHRPGPGPLPETGLGQEGAPATFGQYLRAKWPEHPEDSALEADARGPLSTRQGHRQWDCA